MSISQSNLFSVSVVAASSMPTWWNNAPLTTWYEIPNTTFLNNVQTPQLPPPYLGGGPKNILEAWCGVAHSLAKKKIVAIGGGHGDYAGNDLYEFSYGVNAPFWARIKDYTPAAQIVSDARRYADGNPNIGHSYWNPYFIDSMDELIMHGLNAQYSGAHSSFFCERFTYSTKTWRPTVDCPAIPSYDTTGIGKCKHPVTEDIYYVDGGGSRLWKYTPSTGVSTNIGTTAAVSAYGPMCVDPTRNRILRSRWDAGSSWAMISLTNASTTNYPVTGSVPQGYASALVRDSIGDRFLSVDPFNTVTAIHPTTGVCTLITPSGTTPPASEVLTGGRYHWRTVFDETMKGIFTIPRADSNVWFLKLYT